MLDVRQAIDRETGGGNAFRLRIIIFDREPRAGDGVRQVSEIGDTESHLASVEHPGSAVAGLPCGRFELVPGELHRVSEAEGGILVPPKAERVIVAIAFPWR